MLEVNSIAEYNEKIKKQKRKITFLRTFVLALFFSIWELCANYNIIDPFLFSSPSRVFKTFFEQMATGELLGHIKITLIETIIAFILSTSIGVVFSICLWYFETFRKVCDPYLVLLNSIPKTAIAPIIIVWFGIGYKAIIVVAVSIGVFATTIAYLSTLQEVDVEKVKLIYVFGGNKKDVLTKVLIPYSIPSLISICKINIGLSLIGVIIGEFLVAQKGLGYMIIYGTQIFKLDNVILSISILSVISYCFYKIIDYFDKD